MEPNKRISWDLYFMNVASLISQRSSCNKLHVGCVLVKDNRIISTGYNGHIPGQPHTSYEKNGHELATIHAEQNAICDCASRGINTKGTIAYITHYPCITCFKILVASGVREIIYLNDYKNEDYLDRLIQTKNITMRKFEE